MWVLGPRGAVLVLLASTGDAVPPAARPGLLAKRQPTQVQHHLSRPECTATRSAELTSSVQAARRWETYSPARPGALQRLAGEWLLHRVARVRGSSPVLQGGHLRGAPGGAHACVRMRSESAQTAAEGSGGRAG